MKHQMEFEMKEPHEKINHGDPEARRGEERALPMGWNPSIFEKVFRSIKNGYTGKQNKEGIGLPVSRIETIADSTINMSRVGYSTEADEDILVKYQLNNGDILFSHINSDTHLGKTALVHEEILLHGMNLLRLVPNYAVIKSEFVNHYCRHLRLSGFFSLNCQKAVNQSSISIGKLQKFSIPLPPLPEQERIAARLDLLLGRLKAARKRLDTVPELLKRFRKSVLAMAVSGRFTEEWRAEHAAELPSAEELLAQVRKERREVWEKAELERMRAKGKVPKDEEWKLNYSDLQSDIVNDVISFPIEWCCLRLQDLAELINGDRSSNYPSHRNLPGSVIPFINAGNLEDGKLWVEETDKLTYEQYNKLSSGKIAKDDIIFCIRGSLGKSAIINTEIVGAIASSLVIIRIMNKKMVRFLALFLQSDYCTRQVEELDNGTAQPNLSAGSLSKFIICVPSLLEQREIVRRVDELFAYADALEARVAEARKMADRLEPSILAKAFRGELSEQIPEEALAWEKTFAELEAAAGVLGQKVTKRGRKPRSHAAEGGEAAERATLAVETLPRKRGRPPKIEAQADAPKRPRGRPRKG